MRVFAVEYKCDDGVWHVMFLHKHYFRKIFSHSLSFIKRYNWRIRRVMSQEELTTLQQRFGVTLNDHGNIGVIEWAN